MMMGEAEMEETRRRRPSPANDYGLLDTATITILQPKRLEKQRLQRKREKKNLKYLQTTTYVPNGFFVYACAAHYSRARTTKRR